MHRSWTTTGRCWSHGCGCETAVERAPADACVSSMALATRDAPAQLLGASKRKPDELSRGLLPVVQGERSGGAGARSLRHECRRLCRTHWRRRIAYRVCDPRQRCRRLRPRSASLVTAYNASQESARGVRHGLRSDAGSRSRACPGKGILGRVKRVRIAARHRDTAPGGSCGTLDAGLRWKGARLQVECPQAVPFRTQHPLGVVVNRPSVWPDR